MRSLLCDPLSPYLATPGDRAETMQPKLLDAAVLHPAANPGMPIMSIYRGALHSFISASISR